MEGVFYMSKHSWTKDEHIIALYLYRFGLEGLGDPLRLLKLLDISLSSMIMKFANLVTAIYGKEIGKFRASDMDKEVVEEYLEKPHENFRKKVFNIIYSLTE